jgi:flagellar protein FlgJ
VRRYLPDATAAARSLGLDPRLLLAQAALETGWGAATPQHPDGSSANNLFGIKAGDGWGGARVAHWTMEHMGGVTARKREVFRAYDHAAQSFADYVDVIGGSPRYAEALAHSSDPEAYARAVSEAGYATDPDYADKWLSIYHGDRLGVALRGLNADALAPIW